MDRRMTAIKEWTIRLAIWTRYQIETAHLEHLRAKVYAGAGSEVRLRYWEAYKAYWRRWG